MCNRKNMQPVSEAEEQQHRRQTGQWWYVDWPSLWYCNIPCLDNALNMCVFETACELVDAAATCKCIQCANSSGTGSLLFGLGATLSIPIAFIGGIYWTIMHNLLVATVAIFVLMIISLFMWKYFNVKKLRDKARHRRNGNEVPLLMTTIPHQPIPDQTRGMNEDLETQSMQSRARSRVNVEYGGADAPPPSKLKALVVKQMNATHAEVMPEKQPKKTDTHSDFERLYMSNDTEEPVAHVSGKLKALVVKQMAQPHLQLPGKGESPQRSPQVNQGLSVHREGGALLKRSQRDDPLL